MKRESLKQRYLVAGLACILLIVPIAQVGAATVGFNLVITPRVGFFDPNFGTGVSVSDTFVGTIFFDTSDLTPDGARSRTVLPGGDSLTKLRESLSILL